jgi:ubiquinone/menaquinone biosynthesis C-methylase UbiE
MKVAWDYSERAHTYDKRADYSVGAINELITSVKATGELPVADIGAGTGKLTKLLLASGLTVDAVEPNNNMRCYGISNTQGGSVKWHEGTGENIPLDDDQYQCVFFGSSFNVVDPVITLKEVKRILKPKGFFACMWNHRDITDSLQKDIEGIIHSALPDYDYGSRRKDPSDVIANSGDFETPKNIEKSFDVVMSRQTIIDAWKSHETLNRQAGDKFEAIINGISELVTEKSYIVPYTTRIWHSRLIC